MNSDYPEITIYDYYLILKERIKLFIIVFFGVFIPVLAYAIISPDIYQARSVLLLGKNTPTNIAEQSEIASSYEVVSGLQKSIYGNTGDSKELEIKLKVEPKRNCGIITFSYEDKDKDKALKIVKKWVKRYLILNQIYSAQEVKDKGNILVITKPYLVGVVKPQRLRVLLSGLFFGIFAGASVVIANYAWQEAKKNRVIK